MTSSSRIQYHNSNDDDDGRTTSDYGQRIGWHHNQDDDGRTTTDYGHKIGHILPSEQEFRVDGSVTTDRKRFGGDDQSDVGKAVGKKREVDDAEHDGDDGPYLRGATSDMLSAWEKRVTSLVQDYESLRESEVATGPDVKERDAICRRCEELIQEFDAGTVAGGDGCEEIFQGTWALRKQVSAILDNLLPPESRLLSKRLEQAAAMIRPRSREDEFSNWRQFFQI